MLCGPEVLDAGITGVVDRTLRQRLTASSYELIKDLGANQLPSKIGLWCHRIPERRRPRPLPAPSGLGLLAARTLKSPGRAPAIGKTDRPRSENGNERLSLVGV